MSKTRDSSIDLLRILAAIGVVCDHYIPKINLIPDGSIKYLVACSAFTFSVCCVPIFIIITGYYLVDTNKRRVSKLVELTVQLMIFAVTPYIIACIFGANTFFSIKDLIITIVPSNYYLVLYSVLYLLSPYINKIIIGMDYDSNKRFLLLVLICFSVEPTIVDFVELLSGRVFQGLNMVGLNGDDRGFTIVNFVMLYIVGAYIKKGLVNKISTRYAAFIMLMLFALLLFKQIASEQWGLIVPSGYHTPLVIMCAAFTVIVFAKMDFHNKVISELGLATYTCFIFHWNFLDFVDFNVIRQSDVFYLIGHLLLFVIGIYMASYIAYKIYRLCSGWFFELINPWIDKIELYGSID